MNKLKKEYKLTLLKMSGIAGPVKSEIGNKQRIIKDIPFKLNLKYSNIFIYNFYRIEIKKCKNY